MWLEVDDRSNSLDCRLLRSGTARVCRCLLSKDKRRPKPALRGDARRASSVMLRLRLRDINLDVILESFSLNFASGRRLVTTTATSSLETVTKV